MVGQKNLLSKLDKYTLDTLPHAIILVGEKGSGKHTVIKYLADKLKLNVNSIGELTSSGNQLAIESLRDAINNIYLKVNPTIYTASAELLTKETQGPFLLLLEKIPANAFIILTAESGAGILNTINNRCITFEMDKYTRDELKEFTKGKDNEDLLLDLYRTPGQIINAAVTDLVALNKLCDAIVTSLAKANYANTLTIVNKINYKDDYNKFDFNNFIEMLVFKLFNKYLEENNINYLNMYLAVVEERKKLTMYKTMSKEIWLENLLTRLWKMLRQ